MSLKIANRLKPEDIEKTIHNLENTSSDLVKKVMAGKTTYQEELEKLIYSGKKEFDKTKGQLVEALKQYSFITPIEGAEAKLLSHRLFHEEINDIQRELLSTRKGYRWVGTPLLLGATLATYLIGYVFLPVGLGILAIASGVQGFCAMRTSKLLDPSKNIKDLTYDRNFLAIRIYNKMKDNFTKANEFMEDMPLLKGDY